MKTYLNTREAADFLGVSVWTVRKWRALGKGPLYTKWGGKTGHARYLRDELIAFASAYAENVGAGA